MGGHFYWYINFSLNRYIIFECALMNPAIFVYLYLVSSIGIDIVNTLVS